MKKFIIGFFAVFFQLAGLVFYTTASPDYGDMMLATFISELIAGLLFFWLLSCVKEPKRVLTAIKLGMAWSASLGLWAFVAYLDIRGFLG